MLTLRAARAPWVRGERDWFFGRSGGRSSVAGGAGTLLPVLRGAPEPFRWRLLPPRATEGRRGQTAAVARSEAHADAAELCQKAAAATHVIAATVGTGCSRSGQHAVPRPSGSCHERIEGILQQTLGQAEAEVEPEKPAKARLSNIQKMKLIEETLEREIQPTLAKDGGSIELVDIIGDRVLVALRGACATCVASDITLKHYVESKLRELVTDNLVVEEGAQ